MRDRFGQLWKPRPQVTGETSTPPDDERLHSGAASARSPLSVPRSGFRNVAPSLGESLRLQSEERSLGRSYFFFWILAATAVLVMLLTIGSMGLRWIQFARSKATATAKAQTTDILPLPPAFSAPAGVNRPIRIDANQPQTRLGIDLAVFEQARARQTRGTTALHQAS